MCWPAHSPPTEGEIYINGKKVQITNAKVANQHGIRFIHQELNLCNDLKVFENMFLGEELKKKTGLLDKKEMTSRCAQVFQRMKVNIDPNALVADLPAAEKQLVEIAKALLFRSELIIMDEPSTALSTREIENLFEIMRQLKKDGVSFIYISHKMPELFEICDTYYVLRDGKLVAYGRFDGIDENGITEQMIGRQLADDDFSNHVCVANDQVAMSREKPHGPRVYGYQLRPAPGGDPGHHRPAGQRPGRGGGRPVRRDPLHGHGGGQWENHAAGLHQRLYAQPGSHGAPDA